MRAVRDEERVGGSRCAVVTILVIVAVLEAAAIGVAIARWIE